MYQLYATVGPCNISKPRSWNPIEHSKWTSWNGLGNMPSTEAMRLFVKILEEEDPAWYSRVPEPTPEPVVEVEVENPSVESTLHHENSSSVPKETATDNGSFVEAEDKDVVLEGLGSVGVYDQWVALSVSGRRPTARYEHAAAVVQERMYVVGGNHNGRYLNDIQVHVLKPSHKGSSQPKILESPGTATLDPLLPTSNGVRDIESEDMAQDGKVREIVMDNPESEPVHQRSDETKERIIATLKADKDNLETILTTEHAQTSRLKQELAEAQTANAELTEELRSVRGQLAAEQSRCFRLEVDVAELRQKMQSMEALQKEVELLQRQKAASDQAAAHATQKQSSGGVWSWIAGSPPDQKSVEA